MSLYVRDAVVSRLVRAIMRDGKKHSALRIVDESLAILRKDFSVERPVDFLKRAVENAKPLVELKKMKASGRALQVPSPCQPGRQESLAMRFIRDAFRDRKEHGSGLRLARELVDLEAKTGKAYRKREELHRQAEANRAFAHFLR